MSVEFLPTQSFINLPSLSTLSKAPRFSPEAAPKYLKLPKSIQLKCTSRKLCFAMGQRTPHEVESRVGHKDGVIIVDHGSRRKESNLLLNEFVLMFKSKTGYAIVEPAHMELAEPTIKDAFGSCVQQGANRVIISPFFLFPGRHWHQDIPSLAEAAAKEHPGIPYLVTAPLGLHELLVVLTLFMSFFNTYCLGADYSLVRKKVLPWKCGRANEQWSLGYVRREKDVVKDRIEYCLSRVDGEADECSVCAGTGRCQLKVKEPETSNAPSSP